MTHEHRRRAPKSRGGWVAMFATVALTTGLGCRGAGGNRPDIAPIVPTEVSVGGEVATSGTPPAEDDAATPVADDPRYYYARCGDDLVNLEQVVVPIIDWIASQGNISGTGEPGIPYARDPADELRDCSGNFLRVSSALAAACPNHADTLVVEAGVAPWTPDGDNVFRGTIRARDSRDTARWYHDQGLFTPIFCDGDTTRLSADMAANVDKIRPGAVVWYAHSGECLTRNDGIQQLLSSINHVATVRSVARDESGTVVAYDIYHGRSAGRGSGIDTLERVYSGSTTGIPPYGNWLEPVVGIAPIMPTQ